jgi:hypothetical protein
VITIQSVLTDMGESTEILSTSGIAVKPSKLGDKVARLQQKFDAFAADDARRIAAKLPVERDFHAVKVKVVGNGQVRVDYLTGPTKA